MAYQPIVDVVERRIASYEALVRGVNGEGAQQMLSAVTPESLYGFDQACRVTAIEQAAALGLDRPLCINFLPNAVYEPASCIRHTLAAAKRTGFARDMLTFEVSEGERALDEDHLRRIFSEYKRMGFRVALDDFGAGYSSLSRLVNLRPDVVKIDRELIRDCDADAARLCVIESLAGIGRKLDITIVAEGVERVAEARALMRAGIRYMQGFLFARPVIGALARDGIVREAFETPPPAPQPRARAGALADIT
jgi:EAL domain-containing protein (putative c-di-GMP-specific phosphodiesterase class I)